MMIRRLSDPLFWPGMGAWIPATAKARLRQLSFVERMRQVMDAPPRRLDLLV